MDSIRLKARAKINLGLDVTGKREDGYHEVRMVMQSINLYDSVRITKSRDPGIRISTNRSYLPTNEDNLVYKAVKLMMDEYGINSGVDVVLDKFIPVAAGMAGGSSDAAAAMVGMMRLFSVKTSMRKLMELGVRIGADVPFCVMRGTVLAEGIGEKLTRLQPMPSCPILIAKPGISVSTKFVYGNLRLNENTVHPDIDGMIEAIGRGDIEGICSRMGNVLESVTIGAYPVIEEIKRQMMASGAINAMMSGSGPTVFGIFGKRKNAAVCANKLRESGIAKQIYVTDVFHCFGR
ncbi:MAG: 4-(cytidine 5'-diphospho)-2-C-methyl-D-erythritol kinase [Alistipes sp.]|nr:4-(cytidine 5'-diphospho)-2-C-methyl-D-erythritol kinase [Alistipes sp.]